MSRTIEVTVQLPGGNEVVAGRLEAFDAVPGTPAAARFAYTRSYLESEGSYNLSPELHFGTGPQDTPVHRHMFFGFEDASPDRWGRELIQYEADWSARHHGVPLHRLTGFETLLRVPDNTRQGAVRFWDGAKPVGRAAAPSTVELISWEELIAAADSMHTKQPSVDGLEQLFRYGSASPGGARPKTNVLGSGEQLMLAKLPHPEDRWDVSRWEAAVIEMSARAGIDVPAHLLHPFGSDRSILLLERFDRAPDGSRRGYQSARALLQIDDADTYRGSYTHFAAELGRLTNRENLHQLFRRVALTTMVTNADDHMRNHGLLRTKSGWELSPQFDVNPERHPSFSSTPFQRDGSTTGRDLRELLDLRDAFELTLEQATDIMIDVERATRDWADIGRQLGEPEDELAFFAPMFEGENREWVRTLSHSGAHIPAPSPARKLGSLRRRDQGLGNTAGGGNAGSFATRKHTPPTSP